MSTEPIVMDYSNFRSCVQGFLLDLDGTLVDTKPLHFASANYVLEKYGCELKLEEFNSFIGWAEDQFWNELKERYRIPEAVSSLTKERTHKFLNLLQDTSIESFPGVCALLKRLQQLKIPYAIASNSPRDQIACIVKNSNLNQQVSLWFSGCDDVEYGKPAPDVYITAARALGLQPQQCVVLEDSYSGVVAAHAAGTFVIAIAPANHLDQKLHSAHLQLPSISKLLPLIEILVGNCSGLKL